MSTSSIGRFETGATADYRRARTAALIDFTTALVLAMLAFPFPFARAALSRPVFVLSILATIVVFHVAYLAIALVVWGRTPGMYLLDIGLEGDKPSVATALAWAAGGLAAFVPIVLSSALGDPEHGLPARLSGRRTLSTSADQPMEGP